MRAMSDAKTQYELRRDLALSKMTAAEREDFWERAGIVEFCGGLSRVKAERLAYSIVMRGRDG